MFRGTPPPDLIWHPATVGLAALLAETMTATAAAQAIKGGALDPLDPDQADGVFDALAWLADHGPADLAAWAVEVTDLFGPRLL